jgi:hypothetical protein
LAIKHTALGPQRDLSWPSNTPVFALKETPLGHQTHRSLRAKSPFQTPNNAFQTPKTPENGKNGQHLLLNQAHIRLNLCINADDARN